MALGGGKKTGSKISRRAFGKELRSSSTARDLCFGEMVGLGLCQSCERAQPLPQTCDHLRLFAATCSTETSARCAPELLLGMLPHELTANLPSPDLQWQGINAGTPIPGSIMSPCSAFALLPDPGAFLRIHMARMELVYFVCSAHSLPFARLVAVETRWLSAGLGQLERPTGRSRVSAQDLGGIW
jgi:hypothetical protein